MWRVRSATRANLPSWYAFSFVSPPPPKTAIASAPSASWIATPRGDDVERLVPGDRLELAGRAVADAAAS